MKQPKINRREFFLILLVATVALYLWAWLPNHLEPSVTATNTDQTIVQTQSNKTKYLSNTNGEISVAKKLAPTTGGSHGQGLSEERVLDQWRTPIEFYGKVIDENTNPVSGAKIDFESNDTSPTGTSFYHAESDTNGLFSIKDIQGKLLGVNVSKKGYYSYLPFGDNFYYAGENLNFVPNQSNPVVFRLRKKGQAEQLIRFRKTFRVPKDGTPIEVDLTMAKLASTGNTNFKVECWTDNAGKRPGDHFDWKCRVSLVGGGIQPYTEEFPFSAPEQGYESSEEIDMIVKPDQPWHSDVGRHYFIRTADGRYGRIAFRMIAHGEHFCQIESYFNPSDSRNLEFDPNNAIQAGQ